MSIYRARLRKHL